MQEYHAKVTAKKYLTPNVVELLAKLTKPRVIRFRAGQFVFFKVGGAFKAYSITSPPADKSNLRFLIKLEKNGVGSNFVNNLKIAEHLEFTGPEGNFIIRAKAQNICCLAAGIGIAPFVSMIPYWLSKKPPGKLMLIYGTKTENDIFYSREFAKLSLRHKNFRFIPLPGMRLADYLRQNYANLTGQIFYICGKPQAVKDIQNFLDKKGHKQERVYTENFLA